MVTETALATENYAPHRASSINIPSVHFYRQVFRVGTPGHPSRQSYDYIEYGCKMGRGWEADEATEEAGAKEDVDEEEGVDEKEKVDEGMRRRRMRRRRRRRRRRSAGGTGVEGPWVSRSSLCRAPCTVRHSPLAWRPTRGACGSPPSPTPRPPAAQVTGQLRAVCRVHGYTGSGSGTPQTFRKLT